MPNISLVLIIAIKFLLKEHFMYICAIESWYFFTNLKIYLSLVLYTIDYFCYLCM